MTPPYSSTALSAIASIDRQTVKPEQIRPEDLYVGLENIDSEGRFSFVEQVEPGALKSNKFRFEPEHVLYGKLRPYLSKIARPDFAGICSTDILPIRPGPGLHGPFLHHFLRTPSMVDHASSLATGINLPRLSPKALGGFQVPLPPIEEQRRIAAILDAADELRAKRRQALAKLDTLTQAIFIDMFGDPAPGEMKPLGEILRVSSGNGLTKSQMAEGGTFPVFGGNGINGYHDEFMFDDRQVVVGRVGVYCGAVHYTPERSWITDNALIVKDLDPGVLPEYLVECLRFTDLNRYSDQAAQPLISGKKIYPVKVRVPTIARQGEFVERISGVRASITVSSTSNSVLNTLFASLQQRAFAGEL